MSARSGKGLVLAIVGREGGGREHVRGPLWPAAPSRCTGTHAPPSPRPPRNRKVIRLGGAPGCQGTSVLGG
eukprot:7467966-Pyramimonas_sp.AAC.1